jgi:hypothetical protein
MARQQARNGVRGPGFLYSFVMPGFMPGIHVLFPELDVDGRDKPGHDE